MEQIENSNLHRHFTANCWLFGSYLIISKPHISENFTETKDLSANVLEIEVGSINIEQETDSGKEKPMYQEFFINLPQPAIIVDLNVNIHTALPAILNPKAEELLCSCENFYQESMLEASNFSLHDLINSSRRKVTQHIVLRDIIKMQTHSLKNSSVPVTTEKVFDIAASSFECDKERRMMGIILMEIPKDRGREKEVLETFKASLICTLSHELYNPMNSLLSLLNMMPNCYDDDSKEDLKENALVSAELLHCKIQDLIDYTKIELNEFKAEEIEFFVDELFIELRKIFKYEVNHRGNHLSFETKTSGSRRLFILADRQRIKQILVKLVSNANRYTTNGEINVRACENPDNLDVAFSVTDNGVGISKEKLTLIFASLNEKAKLVKSLYEGSTKLPD